MAKIPRYNGNLQAFASEALGQERVVFGNNGSPPLESDDLTTNIDSNFERGWGVLPLGNKPPREWFNSVAWVSTQLSAYLHQVGVAEWDDEQEYHTDSYAQSGGVLYRSLQDDNVGNPVTDPAWWLPQPSSVAADETYLIPSQFATLQEAIDTLSLYKIPGQGYIIDIVIESGHEPTVGLSVENGDYGAYRISSQDDPLTLGAGGGGKFIVCKNGIAPVLNCSVEGGGTWDRCYDVTGGVGKVIQGAALSGFTGRVLYGNVANIVASQVIFDNCGEIYGNNAKMQLGQIQISNFTGPLGSLIASRGSSFEAEGMSITDSVRGLYAKRAGSSINAHGSTFDNIAEKVVDCDRLASVSIDDSVATDVLELFIENNGGNVSASGVNATAESSNSTEGVLCRGGSIELQQSTIEDFGEDGVQLRNACKGNLNNMTITGSGRFGVYCLDKSIGDCTDGVVTGSGTSDLAIARGSEIVITDGTLSSGAPSPADTNVASFNAIDGNNGIIWD